MASLLACNTYFRIPKLLVYLIIEAVPEVQILSRNHMLLFSGESSLQLIFSSVIWALKRYQKSTFSRMISLHYSLGGESSLQICVFEYPSFLGIWSLKWYQKSIPWYISPILSSSSITNHSAYIPRVFWRRRVHCPIVHCTVRSIGQCTLRSYQSS